MNKIFLMVLTFVAVISSGEAASNDENVFDPVYSVGIVSAVTEVSQFEETTSNYKIDYWQSSTYIKFDNGLIGIAKAGSFY